MRNEHKTKLVNLRPQHRLNQVAIYDGKNNTAKCEFAFNKPIHIKSEGRVALRSAFIPLTYKNVILGFNDRFVIKLNPADNSADADCVYVTVQIPQGQYDTTTALASAINTVLAGLDDTLAMTDDDGGVLNSYNVATTTAVLTGAMTCSVSTDAKYKNHLQIVLPQHIRFSATSILTKDGGTTGTTDVNGGFQILFGLSDTGGSGGDEAPGSSPNNRSAHKLLGFGSDYEKVKTDGEYHPYPEDKITRGASHAVVNSFMPSLAKVLFTPYIYVRCSIVSDSVETVPQGSRTSNLLAKIPLYTSGYGDAIFYEPDDGHLFFGLAPQSIQNLEIHLTDSDGRELPLEESEWEIALMFQGSFDI